MLSWTAALLKHFATFSVDCGLKSSSVFPSILAFNLKIYVHIALKDDGLSSPCTYESLGCRGDHRPVVSAKLPVGRSSCGCTWTHIPASPGARVWAVPPIMPKRVEARVAGMAPLDGGPETAVTHPAGMWSKTCRSWFEACLSPESGIRPWPSEDLEPQMSSTCRK